MREYQVVLVRSARRELERLPRAAADRIVAAPERLAADSRPEGSWKLQGSTELWRLRVGDYRVVYLIDDAHKLVDVRVVRHRKDAYR